MPVPSGATRDRGNVSNPTVRLSGRGLPGMPPGETAARRRNAATGAATGKGLSAMTVRIVSRLILLLVALAAATALMVGALSVLNPDDAAKLLERDQVAAVERAIETPAEEASGTSPTPAVVLIFAGIVLMAALPPIHRVHVYHRSYHRSDWL